MSTEDGRGNNFNQLPDTAVNMQEGASNIVRLASVNNKVAVVDKAAAQLVVAFLREWADDIEKGETLAERAVLILHHKAPDGTFVIKSRRCNVELLEQVGMMHLALMDVSEYSHYPDDNDPDNSEPEPA